MEVFGPEHGKTDRNIHCHQEEQEPADRVDDQPASQTCPPFAVGVAHPAAHQSDMQRAGNQHDKNECRSTESEDMPIEVVAERRRRRSQIPLKGKKQIANQCTGYGSRDQHQACTGRCWAGHTALGPNQLTYQEGARPQPEIKNQAKQRGVP